MQIFATVTSHSTSLDSTVSHNCTGLDEFTSNFPGETMDSLVARAYGALHSRNMLLAGPHFVCHSIASASFVLLPELKLYKADYFAFWRACESDDPLFADCSRTEYYWAESGAHALRLLALGLSDESWLDEQYCERKITIEQLHSAQCKLRLTEAAPVVGRLQ